MVVMFVISVSLRDSTLLTLDTDTVASLLDLKNLTKPFLVSTCSILCWVSRVFLSSLRDSTRSEGWRVLAQAWTHSLGPSTSTEVSRRMSHWAGSVREFCITQ